jgi:hypothetical protein
VDYFHELRIEVVAFEFYRIHRLRLERARSNLVFSGFC